MPAGMMHAGSGGCTGQKAGRRAGGACWRVARRACTLPGRCSQAPWLTTSLPPLAMPSAHVRFACPHTTPRPPTFSFPSFQVLALHLPNHGKPVDTDVQRVGPPTPTLFPCPHAHPPPPQMWDLLAWQGRHPQAPVAVAQRSHYFCELDLPRTLRHLIRCRFCIVPLPAASRQGGSMAAA